MDTAGPRDRSGMYALSEPVYESPDGTKLHRATKRVEFRKSDRFYAVKVFNPAAYTTDANIRRWEYQVETLRNRDFQQDNIFRFHDAFVTSSGAPWLITEWVNGTNFRDWVAASRALPGYFDTALKLLSDIGAALDYIHGLQPNEPVVHADVKPSNIIVTSADAGDPQSVKAVLIDFGLLRLSTDADKGWDGTPGYLAPEVLAAGWYSPASDRFALGGVVRYALTGDEPPPLQRPDGSLKAWADWQEEMAAPLRMTPQAWADPALVDKVMRAFAHAPRDRPESAKEWIRSLQGGRTTVSGDLATPAVAATVPPRRRKWARALLSAVALVAALFVVVRLVDRGSPSADGRLLGPSSSTSGTGPSTTAGGARTTTSTAVPGTYYEDFSAAHGWPVGRAAGGELSVTNGAYVMRADSSVAAPVPSPPAPFRGDFRLEVTASKESTPLGAVGLECGAGPSNDDGYVVWVTSNGDWQFQRWVDGQNTPILYSTSAEDYIKSIRPTGTSTYALECRRVANGVKLRLLVGDKLVAEKTDEGSTMDIGTPVLHVICLDEKSPEILVRFDDLRVIPLL